MRANGLAGSGRGAGETLVSVSGRWQVRIGERGRAAYTETGRPRREPGQGRDQREAANQKRESPPDPGAASSLYRLRRGGRFGHTEQMREAGSPRAGWRGARPPRWPRDSALAGFFGHQPRDDRGQPLGCLRVFGADGPGCHDRLPGGVRPVGSRPGRAPAPCTWRRGRCRG